MAVFAVHVKKDIAWRGSRAPIGNTYHYKTAGIEPFDDVGAINAIVAAEKILYATTVNFLEGRTWGPTDGTPADNKMREVVQLTGTGSNTPTTGLYPELAIMLNWPLGRYGVRNHPQFLRKWHHLGRNEGLPTDGSRFTGTTPAWITNYMVTVESLEVGVGPVSYALCTADGEHEAPLGGGRMYPYLEHRQIGK